MLRKLLIGLLIWAISLSAVAAESMNHPDTGAPGIWFEKGKAEELLYQIQDEIPLLHKRLEIRDKIIEEQAKRNALWLNISTGYTKLTGDLKELVSLQSSRLETCKTKVDDLQSDKGLSKLIWTLIGVAIGAVVTGGAFAAYRFTDSRK